MINETMIVMQECIDVANTQIIPMRTSLIVLGIMAGLFFVCFMITEIYRQRYFGYIEQTGQSQKYLDWIRRRRLS